jgi:hypothetical protein
MGTRLPKVIVQDSMRGRRSIFFIDEPQTLCPAHGREGIGLAANTLRSLLIEVSVSASSGLQSDLRTGSATFPPLPPHFDARNPGIMPNTLT